jgi:hypothetical protein
MKDRKKHPENILVEIAPGHYVVQQRVPRPRTKPLPPKRSTAKRPPLAWTYRGQDRTIVDASGAVVAHNVDVVSQSPHNQQVYLRFLVDGVVWVARTLKNGGMQAKPSQVAAKVKHCSNCPAVIPRRNQTGVCKACAAAQKQDQQAARTCATCGKRISRNSVTGFCRKHYIENEAFKRHAQTWNPWMR